MKTTDDGGTVINYGSLGSNAGTNIYSLIPNNVALKSVAIMSWFRLAQDEKNDFGLALSLAINHPELFEVGQLSMTLPIFKKWFNTSLALARQGSSF